MYIIDSSSLHGHTAVTDETFVAGEKKRIKIPAACKQFNVPYMTPHDMLRAEGVRFIWRP